MDKKRIVILSDKFFPFIGGIEVMSLFLANTFVKNNYIVKVITWTKDNNKNKFPFEIIRNPSNIRVVNEFIWADLVIENNPTFKLSWPLIVFRKPLVIVLHTWISRSDGTKNWKDLLKKIWLKRANKIIAVSKALKNNSNIDAEVITNPYDNNTFKLLNKGERNCDFVFLGRLVSDKGVHLAIELIHKLSNKDFKVNLTIIGEGPEKENLKELTKKLCVTKKINFTGPLRGGKLVETLNQHRYIIVPSVWEEPFGIVALEGMACGCIPIVSDSGGLPEAIGNAGIIFKKGDLVSLFESAERLLIDDELDFKLRHIASNHLKNHHSTVIEKKYLNVIDNLLID